MGIPSQASEMRKV